MHTDTVATVERVVSAVLVCRDLFHARAWYRVLRSRISKLTRKLCSSIMRALFELVPLYTHRTYGNRKA